MIGSTTWLLDIKLNPTEKIATNWTNDAIAQCQKTQWSPHNGTKHCLQSLQKLDTNKLFNCSQVPTQHQ